MRTLFLLWILVAAVYCDFSEIIFEGKCIGIKHTSPTTEDEGTMIPGSWKSYAICCDKAFDRNTIISGFKRDLGRNDISIVFDKNYDKLAEGNTNCKKQVLEASTTLYD